MHKEPDVRRYFLGSQSQEVPALGPGLYLTATPIGNLADITLRALATLAGADAILCEDTRTTARLLERYGIRVPLKPYHDHNGAKVRPQILEMLKSGRALALVSDAGTPLVNDPGFKLVREAIAEGIKVEMLPGPSAPVMALALSGLPSDRFLFAGFLPPKTAGRRAVLEELKGLSASLIFFETANRIEASLADIAAVLPGRPVAVARELTKLFEEVLRGTAQELLDTISARGGLKGEITLVIGPPDESDGPDSGHVDGAILAALGRASLKQVAAEVAEAFGLPKRDVYQRALELKGQAGGEDA